MGINRIDEPLRDESIDIKRLITKHIHLWPWFTICLIVSLALGMLYIATQETVYQNDLTLLIQEDASIHKLEDLIDYTPISASTTRIQNQIGILTSRELTFKTLKSLDFNIEYYKSDRLVNNELYPNRVFIIEIDSLWPQAVNVPINISRRNGDRWLITGNWNKARLYSFANDIYCGTVGPKEFSIEAEANEWVQTPVFRFKIIEKTIIPTGNDNNYIVYFRDHPTLVEKYIDITVNEVKNSTLLKLSVQGQSKRKNEVFLNTHAQMFLRRDTDKKNLRAQKTIDFIDNQLQHVASLLHLSESNLENFRSSEQILNIDFQSQRSYEQLEALQQEKAQLIIKGEYYEYLSSYLNQTNEDGSELLAPSSIGVDDPLLSQLINQLMLLYTERSELLINSRKDNPLIHNVESRIQTTKNTIRESLRNIIQSNRIAIEGIDHRIDGLSETIKMIPESERALFSIERQFQLHNALYTFLQSKKSEIAITKAGLTPTHEIIDPARVSNGFMVAPKKKRMLIYAGFIGLLVPLAVVFFLNFFNYRIRSSEEVEQITNRPILGHIAKSTDHNHVISFHSHSILAESFRTIRTNSRFVLPTDEKPAIMVTSTSIGEGKTFVSLNLASSYAYLNKRTILLSFDLRKPKLSQYINQKKKQGLSNYLSSNMNPEEIIEKSPIENLDIAYSGPIPPNPTELLSSPKISDLFHYARKHYDYIIVDTPPIGMVTDALLLEEHINTILYLVRHNITPQKHLEDTLKNLDEKKIKNINIIINDTPTTKRFNPYNSYGYYYGYIESR